MWEAFLIWEVCGTQMRDCALTAFSAPPAVFSLFSARLPLPQGLVHIDC